MHCLVTGGLGYIGSHFVVEAIKSNFDVTVIDNLSNAYIEVLGFVKKITGADVNFHQIDLLDNEALQELFAKNRFDAVIHFAGLKAVSESVNQPLRYYQNNVTGTLNLLEQVEKHNIQKFIFSSSATVYGKPVFLPYTEEHPIAPFSPYGQTKVMVEQILNDFAKSNKNIAVASLRYFNPIGSHPSGLLRDNPNGIPNNLFPYLYRVAKGEYPFLNIYGNEYDTPDGTGVRDYLHVLDLVDGHLKALDFLDGHSGFKAINLGTGKGVSVLEMVSAFERVNGINLPYKYQARRDGDIAAFWADASLAKKLLGWQAKYSLEQMVRI